MKTLTELSGSLIRTAAAAVAAARRSLPREEKPADAPVAEVAPQGAVAVAGVAGEAATAAEAPAPPPAPPAAPPAAAPKPAREVESEAVKAALDEAVAKATGASGDRLAMLRAAVDLAGRRAEDVRLVRVFGVEEPLKGAHAVGAYQYVVDFFPSNMKQVAGAPGDERGRGGGRRGAGRGGGGGARGAKGSVSGGFSMDSLREDRKSERGGRGRPGGRRPGGGGAAGGGPAVTVVPPVGTPKK